MDLWITEKEKILNENFEIDDQLPVEIWERILSFSDKSDWFHLSLTNKFFLSLFENQLLWKKIFKRNFPSIYRLGEIPGKIGTWDYTVYQYLSLNHQVFLMVQRKFGDEDIAPERFLNDFYKQEWSEVYQMLLDPFSITSGGKFSLENKMFFPGDRFYELKDGYGKQYGETIGYLMDELRDKDSNIFFFQIGCWPPCPMYEFCLYSIFLQEKFQGKLQICIADLEILSKDLENSYLSESDFKIHKI